MLTNIRVLDWAEGIAGPLACQMLGDMGADVIKIERPQGDWGRGMGPGDDEGSTHFYAINRNKRNISLDVKSEEGLEIAYSLIKDADVLISSYRPGVMESLGMTYEKMMEINPDLIYARVSGYGYTGPLAKLPGSDTILQSVSGIMHLVGEPDGPPYRVGVQVVDHAAARDIVIGVLTGLFSQSRGKKLTEPIDVSLFATCAALQAQQWQELFVTEKPPMRQGNENTVLAPAGLYETKDEEYMSIAILREEHWHKLCHALDLEHIRDHENFSTNILRLENREELENILIPIFKSKTQKEWLQYLTENDILVAPVNNLAQIQENERYMSGVPLIEVPDNSFTSTYGEASRKSVALPIQFENDKQAIARYGPPKRGEHTQQIMEEIGFNEEQIIKLKENNVIF